MTKRVLIQAVAGTLHGSFRRLGRTFTTEGTVVDRSEFTEEEWDILVNERMLHLGPAPEGVEAEGAAKALSDAIQAAIAKLERSDFEEDGTPKLAAVKKALPASIKGVTAELLAKIWSDLKPAS